jgi:hypothetical protein
VLVAKGSEAVAPRRGLKKVATDNNLAKNGTTQCPIQSLGFLSRGSQETPQSGSASEKSVLLAKDTTNNLRLDPCPHQRVRATSLPSTVDQSKSLKPGPAHPSNRLVAQLNETWRVVDDPRQWILQRRKGNPRSKNSGWKNRSFCQTREALLRCIREYCCSPDEGESRCIHEYRGVSSVALQQVRALPERHDDWGSPDDVAGGDDAPALTLPADEVVQ